MAISNLTIVELIQADGGTLKKIATTNGGEYAGPCLWCGGNDRFRVWPKTGRYWCRSCGKTGDEIQYLIERRGLSYREACLLLGREINKQGNIKPTPAIYEPKALNEPGALWQQKAQNFLDGAINNLWSSAGDSIRAWLKDKKGLNDSTIKKACLGLNHADIYEPRASWGLDAALKDDGTERRQWIPSGLVIPHIKDEKVIRLRIRRDRQSNDRRFIVVSGSSTAPLIIGQDRGAVVIVESELDALLLSQETGDLVSIIALGTATAKPDVETNNLLQTVPIFLNCLDTDDAGAKASWKFWPDTYSEKIRRWPTIKGKDASEAKANGLDLRIWIIAGLFGTESKFERFCIQTIDGGLSDIEAMNYV